MNVSQAADAAFMRELQRTDPARYTNLIRNMRHAAGAASLAERKVQAGSHLGGRPKKYADKAAKQRAYRNRAHAALTVTKPSGEPFIPMELPAPN